MADLQIPIDPDNRNQCKKCGSLKTHVENYSMMWHDGDVICDNCDSYVRSYDAG